MSDPIHIGLCAVPWREDNLRVVVERLRPQCDHMSVVLNGYDKSPGWMPDDVYAIIASGEEGDAMKFWRPPEWGSEGYFFTCDDDLYYPYDYVETTIAALEKYGRKDTAVAWGGKILRSLAQPFINFHHHATLKRFRVFSDLDGPRYIHVPLTCVFAYHSDAFFMDDLDCPAPNMGDIHAAIAMWNQGVRCVVPPHKGDWVQHQEIDLRRTIYHEKRMKGDRVETQYLNTVNWQPLPVAP